MALETVLHTPGLTLLLDGVTEATPEAQKAILDDVTELAEDNPSMRIVVTGRTHGSLRPWAASTYALVPPSRHQRIAIAESVFAGQGHTIENEVVLRIGELANNPLLYSLALTVFSVDSIPSVPAQLYREFLRVLSNRSHGVLTATARIVVAQAARTLLLAGRRRAYALEWIGLLTESVTRLVESGTLNASVSGEHVLNAARTAGLLVGGDWDEIAFLHDSFADFLVAETYAAPTPPLPDKLSENLYDVIDFIAQQTEPSDELVLLASQDPTLASRISRWERTDFAPEHLTRFRRCLDEMFGGNAPFVALCRDEGWISAAIAQQPTRWVSPEHFVSVSTESDLVVGVPDSIGPVRAAVEVWATLTAQNLERIEGSVLTAIPDDKEDIIDALNQHFMQLRSSVDALARIVSPRQSEKVIAATHTTGFLVYVGEETQNPITRRRDFHVVYSEGGEDIVVSAKPFDSELPKGTTVASHLLDTDPRLEARSRIVKALAELSDRTLRL